jgi:6-phosphogluconate dehydrogenase
MQLGMVGLGRMGANMVRRLLKGGHRCVVYDRAPQAVGELVQEKAEGSSSCATSWLSSIGRAQCG